MNFLDDMLTRYYSNRDARAFIKDVYTYVGMKIDDYYIRTIMDEEISPLIYYLDRSLEHEKGFPGPYELWPASKAVKKWWDFGCVEYELFNDFGFNKRLPVIKIGKDVKTSTTFWLILNPVYRDELNRYALVMAGDHDKIRDSLYYFFSVMEHDGNLDGEYREYLLECFHKYAVLSVEELMAIQDLLHREAFEELKSKYPSCISFPFVQQHLSQ